VPLRPLQLRAARITPPSHGGRRVQYNSIPMSAHKNQPFVQRFRFALAGLAVAWRGEANFRFQVGACVAVVIALGALNVEPLWWALVLLTSGLVMAAELFNTALEHLVDHLHPETHPRIAMVKDCAAAAVLLAACAAVGVGAALVVHLLGRH
jgi:undecaprenol kinase